jgi:hypothetical protein
MLSTTQPPLQLTVNKRVCCLDGSGVIVYPPLDRAKLSATGGPMARKATDTANLRLRLSEALRKTLASEAEKNNRSLNSEILWRLGQTLSAEWQEFIAQSEQLLRDRDMRMEELFNDPKVREGVAKIVAEHFGHLVPKKGSK